ncbi:YlzJ-like family protein [Acidaminobacterium chupaoyuni]
MLHTIVPMEQIFPTEEIEVQWGSVGSSPAEILCDAQGRKRYGRIYSTCLKDYLNL